MRMLMGIGLVLALVCGSVTAQEKKDKEKEKEKFDAKKLLGKWESNPPKKGESIVMEFAANGKLTMSGDVNGKELKVEGTYKLEGDKLSFELRHMGETSKATITLTKLTDNELEGKDSKGKSEAFKKVKK
ncbi:MAG: TIGR03066 family protein [Planctomycetia bacterium]|nr:TIGR03066 family protein [Planctomycetia bacterium]